MDLLLSIVMHLNKVINPQRFIVSFLACVRCRHRIDIILSSFVESIESCIAYFELR